MTDLLLHGREVHTVFDLLGDKENDITYALGWALSRSDQLLSVLLDEVFDEEPGDVVAVRLQEFLPGGGFTDIEVETRACASHHRGEARLEPASGCAA